MGAYLVQQVVGTLLGFGGARGVDELAEEEEGGSVLVVGGGRGLLRHESLHAWHWHGHGHVGVSGQKREIVVRSGGRYRHLLL